MGQPPPTPPLGAVLFIGKTHRTHSAHIKYSLRWAVSRVALEIAIADAQPYTLKVVYAIHLCICILNIYFMRIYIGLRI